MIHDATATGMGCSIERVTIKIVNKNHGINLIEH